MGGCSTRRAPPPRRPSAWFPVTSLPAVREPPEGPRSGTSVSGLNDGGWRRSFRYTGPRPFRALKVSTNTLNCAQKRPESQCRTLMTGVMWSRRPLPVTSLACVNISRQFTQEKEQRGTRLNHIHQDRTSKYSYYNKIHCNENPLSITEKND